MKLLAVSVFNCRGEEGCFRLLASYNVAAFNYFTRKSIREHLAFASRTIAARTEPGGRSVVKMEEKDEFPFRVLVQISAEGLGIVVVTDEEYPQSAAFQFVILTEENFHKAVRSKWGTIKKDQDMEPSWLSTSLAQWQDPSNPEISKLAQVTMKVEEVKNIMHVNIEQILKNGETLDDMVTKAEELSSQAKVFYKAGKKTNKRCCRR